MSRFVGIALTGVALLVVVAGGSVAYGLSLEEHDDFCASCHTQPEVNYYNRTLKTSPSDLAGAHTAKNAHCIDCHSGPPPLGRKDGLIQGTQDYAAFLTGNYTKPAITTHQLPDANCVKCHENIFASRSIQNHYHFYLPDWQRALGDRAARCVTCHNGHTTADGHVVKYMPDTQINPICALCHEFHGIR
jgi:predicted CXXCH cytochrome family protein